jgi:hypothetical protein
LASELPFICEGEKTPLDDNSFLKLLNDIEALDRLTDEDRDLLRKLAWKAAEMETEEENHD